MSRGDPLRVRDYLEHIAQAIANIQEYTVGMDAAAYLVDKKTQDAVIRNFEVIGEACNKVLAHHAQQPVTPTFRGTSPTRCEMPWRMAISRSTRVSSGGP